MTTNCMRYEVEAGVAHIRLTRPEQRNSMIPEFWHELPDTIRQIEATANARVIVISAEGPHFSSGMDLSVFESNSISTSSALNREQLTTLIITLQEAFNALEQCRLPVIAAVQGACIGAGLDMICACDMRYATESAYFTIHEINIGIMADLGVLQRLPKLIPEGIVRELAYTGNPLPASCAKQFGFVNEVFSSQEELLEQVLSVAKKIAQKAPLAVAGSKKEITFARDHSVREGLEHVAIHQAAILDMEQLQECIKAQRAGRTPEFKDLLPAKVTV